MFYCCIVIKCFFLNQLYVLFLFFNTTLLGTISKFKYIFYLFISISMPFRLFWLKWNLQTKYYTTTMFNFPAIRGVTLGRGWSINRGISGKYLNTEILWHNNQMIQRFSDKHSPNATRRSIDSEILLWTFSKWLMRCFRDVCSREDMRKEGKRIKKIKNSLKYNNECFSRAQPYNPRFLKQYEFSLSSL